MVEVVVVMMMMMMMVPKGVTLVAEWKSKLYFATDRPTSNSFSSSTLMDILVECFGHDSGRSKVSVPYEFTYSPMTSLTKQMTEP